MPFAFQVERDAEGLHQALRTLFEEAYVREQIGTVPADAEENDLDHVYEDLPSRDLSPGYCSRAEYLLDLGAAKDMIATREADAQKAILAREAYLAITKASDESVRARLSGEEPLFQKTKDDLKELRIELANSGKSDQFGAQGGAIQDKYFADLGERQLKRQNDAAKQMRDASAAGLTGAARIQAEHNNRVADINTNPQLADDPGTASQARVAAEQESNQKIAELQMQFSQRACGRSRTAAPKPRSPASPAPTPRRLSRSTS